MPRRNLTIILLMSIVALVCYSKVQTNPYQRILAESMVLVERNALEDVKERQLFEGAMDGMMKSRGDDYSSYLPPVAQKELNDELDSKFGGIGVEMSVDPKTRELTVLMPISDSPAYKAGVLAGDKLLRINDHSTQGMSLSDASELIRGRLGQKVKLTVLHPGDEKPTDLEITRAEIRIATVLGDTHDAKGDWNYFLPGADKIAYIRLTNFAVDTAEELTAALKTATEQKMKGLILDLRDNPGGLLPTACDVCDLFLKNGQVIVTTRGRDGQIRGEYEASGRGSYNEIPMVVLVNQYSASASEIVAACLQDHHRAAIVGQRSYGKGTVQDVIDLEKGCGALRLTIAAYWRPNGKNIQRKHGALETDQWGVQPDDDCKVEVKGEDWKKWYLWRMHRDAQRGDIPPETAEDYRTADRQLEKAVEYLKITSVL